MKKRNVENGKLRSSRKATLYHPSIYRYNCIGAFHATSLDIGGKGSCKGLRSRLELLADMENSSREEALKQFTLLTDYEMEDQQEGSLDQKTKSILVSPALIYKDEGHKKQKLPEEEVIKHQEWSCYGSTEVEYLVLKNPVNGDEKIAAIAPRNTGLSVRTILSNESSITSISMGVVNIVVDSDPREIPQNSDNKDAEDTSYARTPEEVPPRPRTDSIQNAKEWVTRTTAFGSKIIDQMKVNSSFLYNTLQDDFPARTYTAGEKILDQFPKTVQRTSQFMSKMFNEVFGSDQDK